MNSKYRLAWDTINKLYGYSGVLVSLVVDHYLELPGLSYLDEMGFPVIRVNLTKIPLSESVMAHVLAHEYGHHVLLHVNTEPYKLSEKELEAVEDEADLYASRFVHSERYEIAPIELFISDTAPNKKTAEKRIKLLSSFAK